MSAVALPRASPLDLRYTSTDHDPSMHIFYSRRCLDITDGKPKWDQLDESSDLISETD